MCPLLGLIAFNAWSVYRDSHETAGSITDHLLLASALAIAEQIKYDEGAVESPVPPVALELFATKEKDHVVYGVIGPGGDLLTGSRELIAVTASPDGSLPVYSNVTLKGVPMRVVALRQPLASNEPTQTALVMVGETLNSYNRIASDIWHRDVTEQLLLVIMACALAWFSQRRALAPLMQLRDGIMDREAGRLDPLSTNGLQTELQPIVVALNEAFERIGRHVAAQRRFIADAAHQLRTPLSLLKTQASVGLREPDLDATREVFEAIIATTDDLTHLANQLVTLNKVETDHALHMDTGIDLVALCQGVVDQFSWLARERSVRLRFVSDVDQVAVRGDRSLLRELVINLLDNALKYTSSGGNVFLRISAEDESITMTFEDTGIGIPPDQRARVFERFYRVLGTDVEGSGLGLSIVAEIANLHNAAITLEDRDSLPGISVHVRFPGAETRAADSKTESKARSINF